MDWDGVRKQLFENMARPNALWVRLVYLADAYKLRSRRNWVNRQRDEKLGR